MTSRPDLAPGPDDRTLNPDPGATLVGESRSIGEHVFYALTRKSDPVPVESFTDPELLAVALGVGVAAAERLVQVVPLSGFIGFERWRRVPGVAASLAVRIAVLIEVCFRLSGAPPSGDDLELGRPMLPGEPLAGLRWALERVRMKPVALTDLELLGLYLDSLDGARAVFAVGDWFDAQAEIQVYQLPGVGRGRTARLLIARELARRIIDPNVPKGEDD